MIEKKEHRPDITEIANNFKIEGGFENAIPYGSGHINDTFCLVNTEEGSPDYLLQRINHHVFPDVPSLMRNIDYVCRHLKQKLELKNLNPQKSVITLVNCNDGLDYFKDSQGNFWRMYIFLKDTKSYDIVSTEKQAREGGLAFGKFQALLSDMDAELLAETILNFHNIIARLNRFNLAVTLDAFDRLKEVAAEIAFVHERSGALSEIQRMGDSGELPKRITHNDTKFNNILFNEQDSAQCIIDLDTVMPGYVAFDFGDAVRTIINTCSEDEKDLNKISLNIALFKSFTEGYLQEAITFLTEKETGSLLPGVFLLPYMQGVRFLTDYLQGDVYFKTEFKGHNLQRARAQFHLLKKLEEQKQELGKIIEKAVLDSRNKLTEEKILANE